MEHVLILALSSLGALGCYRINESIDTDADADAGMDVATNCDDGHGRLDDKTGLCWQHPKAAGDLHNWQEAIDYCDKLSLGGHKDWRLPSKEELAWMLGGCDSGVLGGRWGYCNTCEDSAPCTALFGSDTVWYWSSSSPDDDSLAWYVNFARGFVYRHNVSNYSSIRCVRSGP